MSRLDQAAERFRAALAAVSEVAGPLADARDSASSAASTIAALREERAQLLVRIAELEEDSRALSGLTEEVETRLDGAIADIRAALGR